jgi:hypothetical protein
MTRSVKVWIDRQGDHGTARGLYFEGATATSGHRQLAGHLETGHDSRSDPARPLTAAARPA